MARFVAELHEVDREALGRVDGAVDRQRGGAVRGRGRAAAVADHPAAALQRRRDHHHALLADLHRDAGEVDRLGPVLGGHAQGHVVLDLRRHRVAGLEHEVAEEVARPAGGIGARRPAAVEREHRLECGGVVGREHRALLRRVDHLDGGRARPVRRSGSPRTARTRCASCRRTRAPGSVSRAG